MINASKSIDYSFTIASNFNQQNKRRVSFYGKLPSYSSRRRGILHSQCVKRLMTNHSQWRRLRLSFAALKLWSFEALYLLTYTNISFLSHLIVGQDRTNIIVPRYWGLSVVLTHGYVNISYLLDLMGQGLLLHLCQYRLFLPSTRISVLYLTWISAFSLTWISALYFI